MVNEMVIYGVLWVKAIMEYIHSANLCPNVIKISFIWKNYCERKNSLCVPLLDTRRYGQALEKVPSK